MLNQGEELGRVPVFMRRVGPEGMEPEVGVQTPTKQENQEQNDHYLKAYWVLSRPCPLYPHHSPMR